MFALPLLIAQLAIPLERSIPLDGPAMGSPVPFPSAERARSILVTLADGRIALLSPTGQTVASMRMDFNATAPALAVDLDGDGNPEIAAADVAGSIYAFDAGGKRSWKHERTGKALDYKALVSAASLLFLSDSRGRLYGVDHSGKLRFQAKATTYRLSAPAVGDFDGDGVTDLVFGTEDREVYAVNLAGKTLWRTALDGRFGRALPAIADLDGDRTPEVLIPTPFVGPKTGLFALDARSGAVRWQARSALQTYHSHVAADLDGDGQPEVLYGDKNTRLYCVTGRGEPRWNTQLGGRGIFSAPALADLEGNGQLTIFQTVRDKGPEGYSLYALNARGAVIGTAALAGGGLTSPVLCRFDGDRALRLLQTDSGRTLHVFRPAQGPNAKLFGKPEAKLAGPRHDYVEIALRREGQPETRSEPPAPSAVRVSGVANPWIDGSEPGGGDEAPLRVEMLGGEFESAAIRVSNPGPGSADYRVTVDGDLARAIRLHEVPIVRPDSTGQPAEDPLPRLGQAQTIHVGSGEARRVWLTISSANLRPGVTKSAIRVANLQSYDAPAEVPIEVRVSNVRLPEKRVFKHCNWLSLPQDPKQREAVIEDALEHGTNVFIVPGTSVAVDAEGNIAGGSAEAFDAAARRLKGAMLLVPGSVAVNWPKGIEPTESTRDRAFENALRWFSEHVRNIGLAFEDFAFYLQDEPGLMGDDANFRAWADLVRRVKKIEPRFQIYANPAGGARAAMLEPMAGLVDIWSPDLHLFRDEPKELGALFSRARHFWHYEAPADQRNLDPLGFYRAKAWVAFQLGMTGAGWWVYHYSAMWQPDRARAPEYGVVYMTADGPVTSKRWEAARDGAEDFELLWMVRERGRGVPEAMALVTEAVEFVTKGQDEASDIGRQLRRYRPDFGRWMELRRRLIAMAERLR